MLIDITKLKDNPYRDFKIDPIDEDNVKVLAESIKEDGFWGGVVCRKINGHYEIGAGHHRVRAALKAGMRTADVFVGELDDGAMIRVYVRENGTQRGNSSTALAGSVASAVKFLAKAIMTGAISREITTDRGAEVARGQLATERGLGEPIITEFLNGLPGITENSVRQQLANIKSSGDYARIIREVQEQIEAENKERLKALARAEKEYKEAEDAKRKADEKQKAAVAEAKAARAAADKTRAEYDQKKAKVEADLAEKRRKEMAAELKQFDALRVTRDTARNAADKAEEREVTFDFEGVAKYFKNDNQVRAFRDVVTGPGVRPFLPVKEQSRLAAKLVALAKQVASEKPGNITAEYVLTASFIRDRTMELAVDAKKVQGRLNKEELERAKLEDLKLRMSDYQHQFARSVGSMTAYADKIRTLVRDNPKAAFHVSNEFREAVRSARKLVDALVKFI